MNDWTQMTPKELRERVYMVHARVLAAYGELIIAQGAFNEEQQALFDILQAKFPVPHEETHP